MDSTRGQVSALLFLALAFKTLLGASPPHAPESLTRFYIARYFAPDHSPALLLLQRIYLWPQVDGRLHVVLPTLEISIPI